jgi:hypothetical protein
VDTKFHEDPSISLKDIRANKKITVMKSMKSRLKIVSRKPP